jgi:hypothetical protein
VRDKLQKIKPASGAQLRAQFFNVTNSFLTSAMKIKPELLSDTIMQ